MSAAKMAQAGVGERRLPAWLAFMRNPATMAPAPTRRRIEALGLVSIFLLALGVRVFYNLTVARNYVPLHDAAVYDAIARHLLSEGCFCASPHIPTTYRPPLFPLFLALVYRLGGVNPLHARLALSVIGAGTCVLAALIARDLFGWRAGLLAGLIAVAYPQLFIWDAWLYSESLAVFSFAACCLVALRLARSQRSLRTWGARWRWLAGGVLFGLTALVRPNGFYALLAFVGFLALAAVIPALARRFAPRGQSGQPVGAPSSTSASSSASSAGARRAASPGARLIASLAWIAPRALPWRRATLGAALLCLGFAVTLAPWVARNYEVTGGAFVPFTSMDGIVIAGSYNDLVYQQPFFQGQWANPVLVPAYLQAAGPDPNNCDPHCEIARSQQMKQLGVHWALSHPTELPFLVVYRMEALWTPASPLIEDGMSIWPAFATLYPLAVILLGLGGMALLLARRRWQALIPVLFAATVTLGAAVFYGSPRMRAPMEPLLVACAAVALVWLFDRAYDRLTGSSPAPVSAQRPTPTRAEQPTTPPQPWQPPQPAPPESLPSGERPDRTSSPSAPKIYRF